ncbi:ATP-binding protein [Salinispira pacifica]|uniref:histidine kinase n=1 Tax=Salinispira pacifica TaxID=1307761 RepID=V5WNI4_9SPIO|nr:ATP-binding protein [Salinispira pacifica]AHC16566.1 hypothetical protein L21SP2_3226 [Salinispira pacifica]
MNRHLSALIVADKPEAHVQIAAALQKCGIERFTVLSPEDDLTDRLGQSTNRVSIIIFDSDSMADPGMREYRCNELTRENIPVIVCLDYEHIDSALRDGELDRCGYDLLPRPWGGTDLELAIRRNLRTPDEAIPRFKDAEGNGDPEGYRGAYHQLFLNNGDGILIHTHDGTILQSNSRAREMLSGTEGDPKGTRLQDYEPSEFRGVFHELIEGSSLHERMHLEVLLQNARNTVFSAEVLTGKIHRSTGSSTLYYSIIRDISQRRMIEDKFKHRLKMESAMSLIAGYFIEVENPRSSFMDALEQLGSLCEADSVCMELYSPEEALFEGSELSWVNRRKLHESDSRHLTQQQSSDLRNALEDEEYIYTESWEGKRIPRMFILPMRSGGRLLGSLWIYSPATPLVYEDRMLFLMIAEMFKSYYLQRQGDAQKRKLIQNLEQKVSQLNCLFSINHLFREEQGDSFSRVEEAVSLLYKHLDDRRFCCIHVQLYGQDISVGECSDEGCADLFRHEYELSRQYNFSLEVYAYDRKLEQNGDHDLIQAVFHEICSYLEQEQLRLQRELMEVQLNHTRRIEAMGELAAGIAHEMNTPNQYIQDNLHFIDESLSAMYPVGRELYEELGGYEEAITDMPYERVKHFIRKLNEIDLPFLQEEIPRAISQSIEGVNKQKQLLDAMRTYSHPGNADPLRNTETNINEVIRDAVLLCRYEWSRYARVETDLQADPPEFFCSPQDISQALINLIVNSVHAIKERFYGDETHTEPLKGDILITSSRRAGQVEIAVKDNGIGIPPEHQNRIFEPFFTTKEVGAGTGQGLAIVYEIIENRHKGEILLRSAPRKGSEFRLILPDAAE